MKRFNNMLSLGSYFTFQSRSKVYAAINAIGLPVSLMFSVLIGLYVHGEMAANGNPIRHQA